MSPFHYHGQPVSAQDAIDLLKNRAAHELHLHDAVRRREERRIRAATELGVMIGVVLGFLAGAAFFLIGAV